MNPNVARMAASFLDWLVPRECLGCLSEIDCPGEWCRRCVEQLQPNITTQIGPLAFTAPWHHKGSLRAAIHRFKYAGRSDFAGRLIASGFAARPSSVPLDALLVPIPLHPLRLVERGYNQSALLARSLAKAWQVACSFDILQRGVATKPQVGQRRAERAANVLGAFSVKSPSSASQALWLVDDVVTTGATALSCREALQAAGQPVEGIIALAHAAADATAPG